MGPLLTDSNPFLLTAADRKRQVFQTVSTSSAIEGVRAGPRKVAKPSRDAAKISHAKPSAGASPSARSPTPKAR